VNDTATIAHSPHLDAVAAVPRHGGSSGLDHCPLMPTFGAPTVTFVRGLGTELWDTNGKRYLDFLGGLAVVSLGHSHPAVAKAIADQASTLLHVSNLFATVPGPQVAMHLDNLLGGGGQVFFANSGAEANECAIKVARKWGGRGRHHIISAFGSFHGRTLATLHMTGQPAKHEAFWPLPEGFRHAAWADVADIERMIDPSTVAVMIEPVQGEGGVMAAPDGYFADLRRLCTERGLLFMVDEIQTGLGRTGKWFGFEHFLGRDARPDVVTLAKALGNGMPIGACWATFEVSSAFKPGDHGSTYSGQPMAASAALAVLNEMMRLDIPAMAERAGSRMETQLRSVPGVVDVRGLGMLRAVELGEPIAGEVNRRLLGRGLVANAVTPSAIRLAPPRNISDDHLDEGVALIAAVLGEVRAELTAKGSAA
jgi:acetylornithine/N-succinyldiaminopimelate aminotransferase